MLQAAYQFRLILQNTYFHFKLANSKINLRTMFNIIYSKHYLNIKLGHS